MDSTANVDVIVKKSLKLLPGTDRQYSSPLIIINLSEAQTSGQDMAVHSITNTLYMYLDVCAF